MMVPFTVHPQPCPTCGRCPTCGQYKPVEQKPYSWPAPTWINPHPVTTDIPPNDLNPVSTGGYYVPYSTTDRSL